MSAVASPLLAPVIVGAGPAGIRAAEILVKAGLRPVVLDEGMRSGGQIYRRPPIDDGRSYRSRYGSEAHKAEALHTTFDTLRGSINYRPETLVWNISRNDGDHLDLLTDGVHGQLPYSHLILATGATDRVLPFKGWTKPGVYTLGASQTALKAQGCTVGERVVFMGSGPLLYLVAWQYHHAGAKVAAVLDTAPFAAKFHLAHLALHAPRIVALGAYYGLRLKLAGVPIHYDVRPDCVLGDGHVEGLRYRTGKSEHEVACDALAYGFALRPVVISASRTATAPGCRGRTSLAAPAASASMSPVMVLVSPVPMLPKFAVSWPLSRFFAILDCHSITGPSNVSFASSMGFIANV
jgi:NADPH-dependent 2,4-dienoyl-CoA reductase/sulfur reductase-like enzyme